MRIDGARTLVVGATGVLGRALAGALADAGARLVVTGRTEGSLDAVGRDLDVPTLGWDAVDLDGAPAVVARAAEALGGLDLLVVALGVAAFGRAEEVDDAVTEALLLVNTQAPVAMVRAALPHLTDGGRDTAGTVAVLSAVLADVPTAHMASYSASKAALSAYLTALRAEQRGGGAHVFDVRPPHIDTGLAERAIAGSPPRLPSGADADAVVARIVEGLREDSRTLTADLRSGELSLD